jgi:hypothetical protein
VGSGLLPRYSWSKLRRSARGSRALARHPPGQCIEHAVGARTSDQDWEQRLADALTAFRDCRWALDHLRPAADGA